MYNATNLGLINYVINNMKPFLLFSFFLFFTSNVISQFYTSFEIAKRKEGGDYYSPKLPEVLFKSATSSRYVNDYYSLGIIKKKKGLILEANLGFVYNKYKLSGYRSHTIYWDHGSHRETTSHRANVDVRYTYLAHKISVSKAFFYKKNFNLLVGGFIQLEILTGSKEINHYDSIVSSYKYSGYGQNGYYTVSGSSTEISYETFNGMSLTPSQVTFGVNLSPRFQIKNFLIIANLSIGIIPEPRTFSNISTDYNSEIEILYKNTMFFTQLGLSIAYQLPAKE